VRAKGFSRKYFDCLPYCRLKKHTAESPAVTQLLPKERSHQRTLRGEQQAQKMAAAAALGRKACWEM